MFKADELSLQLSVLMNLLGRRNGYSLTDVLPTEPGIPSKEDFHLLMKVYSYLPLDRQLSD